MQRKPPALDIAIKDHGALHDLVLQRATAICHKWATHGCSRARYLSNFLSSFSHLQIGLDTVAPLRRLDFPQSVIEDPARCISRIRTSGSSGVPLEYCVSESWRATRRHVWALAYQELSNGRIAEYLDSKLVWAMARVPGGPIDNLSNLIECLPTASGIDFVSNESCVPAIIHGSSNTMIEMLEYEVARQWNPSFVILTYEKPLPWHIEILQNAWPNAELHEEYASNDGGGTAFTCSGGNLHFWNVRAFARPRDGALRVIDLWNDASGFMGYETGDNVVWPKASCSCELVLPLVSVEGRRSGYITLESGRRVSHLCPFTAEQMKGLRGIRILVQHNSAALVKFVADHPAEIDWLSLTRSLESLGFQQIKFRKEQSLTELRTVEGKYRTIIDSRNATKIPEVGHRAAKNAGETCWRWR